MWKILLGDKRKMKENHSFGCLSDQEAMGLHELSKAQVYQKPKEMAEEELFCNLFPEYVVNGKPLSPYFDLFESGYEQAEKENADLKEEINKIAFARGTLEEENAELKKEVEKHKWNDIFLEDCADYDKKIAEEYTTLQERIAELEEENAELKKSCQIQVDGAFQMIYEKDDQLTKAKELLAKLLEEEKNNMYWEMNGSDKSSYYEVRKEAEQFLNSEVEK